MRKIQIGVIGSMEDNSIQDRLKDLAKKIGQEIAKKDAILVYGFEGDCDSLSQISAREAERAGGGTIAFVWGDKKVDNNNSLQIITGSQRGGGREYSFILSCDVIIAVGGGSGTLMEIAMAYQSNIPIVAMQSEGGWSNRLIGEYLDERKRLIIIGANSAEEAVEIALKEATKKNDNFKTISG